MSHNFNNQGGGYYSTQQPEQFATTPRSDQSTRQNSSNYAGFGKQPVPQQAPSDFQQNLSIRNPRSNSGNSDETEWSQFFNQNEAGQPRNGPANMESSSTSNSHLRIGSQFPSSSISNAPGNLFDSRDVRSVRDARDFTGVRTTDARDVRAGNTGGQINAPYSAAPNQQSVGNRSGNQQSNSNINQPGGGAYNNRDMGGRGSNSNVGGSNPNFRSQGSQGQSNLNTPYSDSQGSGHLQHGPGLGGQMDRDPRDVRARTFNPTHATSGQQQPGNASGPSSFTARDRSQDNRYDPLDGREPVSMMNSQSQSQQGGSSNRYNAAAGTSSGYHGSSGAPGVGTSSGPMKMAHGNDFTDNRYSSGGGAGLAQGLPPNTGGVGGNRGSFSGGQSQAHFPASGSSQLQRSSAPNQYSNANINATSGRVGGNIQTQASHDPQSLTPNNRDPSYNKSGQHTGGTKFSQGNNRFDNTNVSDSNFSLDGSSYDPYDSYPHDPLPQANQRLSAGGSSMASQGGPYNQLNKTTSSFGGSQTPNVSKWGGASSNAAMSQNQNIQHQGSAGQGGFQNQQSQQQQQGGMRNNNPRLQQSQPQTGGSNQWNQNQRQVVASDPSPYSSAGMGSSDRSYGPSSANASYSSANKIGGGSAGIIASGSQMNHPQVDKFSKQGYSQTPNSMQQRKNEVGQQAYRNNRWTNPPQVPSNPLAALVPSTADLTPMTRGFVNNKGTTGITNKYATNTKGRFSEQSNKTSKSSPAGSFQKVGKPFSSSSKVAISKSNQWSNRDSWSRSKSPISQRTSSSYSRRSRSRSDSRSRGGGKRSAPTRSPPRIQKTTSSTTARKVDFATMSISQISKDFNLPEISRSCHVCSIPELYSRYPNLYIPADFVRLDMDWNAAGDALHNGIFSSLNRTATMVFESNPAPLGFNSSDPECADMLELPKFTYLNPQFPLYNSHSSLSNNFIGSNSQILLAQAQQTVEMNIKPLKFNARVIVTLGFRDSLTERVDFTITRKLRILCGRRKNSIMLLGGSWCKELDGGDPLTDRSCLLNTARRTLLAQCLLDITDESNCAITKLCEISYHRPKEEFKGKAYPDQDEITVIYLCSLSNPVNMSDDEFDRKWKIFTNRVYGKHPGPLLNSNPEDGDFDDNFGFDESHENSQTEIVGEDHDAHAHGHADEDATSAQVKEENDVEEEKVVEEVMIPTAESVESSSIVDLASEGISVPVASDACDKSETTEGEGRKSVEEEVEVPETAMALGDAEEDDDSKEKDLSSKKAEPASTSVETVVVKKKPDSPCVLLCPQPLPKDIHDDAQKKMDTIALRVLPLSSILSYTQDDSNERIFEASIAAEVLKSIIAVSSATIIADFLLAEHKSLFYIADPRIVVAVKKLREITSAADAKAKTKNVAKAASIDSSSDSSKSVPDSTTPSAVASATAGSDEQVGMEIAEENSEVVVESITDDEPSASKKMRLSDGDGNGSDNDGDVVVVPAAVAVEGALESPESGAESKEAEYGDDIANNDEEEEESSNHVPSIDEIPNDMDEDEARQWRRSFVSACRWFDLDQERFLRADHLQVILFSAMRDISKSDLISMAWDVCAKEDKLRYETYI